MGIDYNIKINLWVLLVVEKVLGESSSIVMDQNFTIMKVCLDAGIPWVPWLFKLNIMDISITIVLDVFF